MSVDDPERTLSNSFCCDAAVLLTCDKYLDVISLVLGPGETP
jgi:hypothetical protein